MPDRENVIKGLEICTKKPPTCKGCPYFDGCKIDAQKLKEDALSILKEQDERIKLLEHQLETITKWRMNAGAFD